MPAVRTWPRSWPGGSWAGRGRRGGGCGSRWCANITRPGRVSGVMALGGSAGTTIGVGGHAGLAAGRAEIDCQHAGLGTGTALRRRQRYPDAQCGRRYFGLESDQPHVLDEAARAMAGHGVPARPPRRATATNRWWRRRCSASRLPASNEPGKCSKMPAMKCSFFMPRAAGGQAMESLIAEGLIAGVLDITTTELADEFAGGMLSAGPDRLTAAGRAGMPQVVSVGATDMANFHARDTVPSLSRAPFLPAQRQRDADAHDGRRKRAHRRRHRAQGCRGPGPTLVMLPERGVSAIDRAGQPFDDPAAPRPCSMPSAARPAGRKS